MNKEYPVNKGHTSINPFLEKIKQGIKPPKKVHLSIKTMFYYSVGWPLFTGLTVELPVKKKEDKYEMKCHFSNFNLVFYKYYEKEM